MLWNDVKIPSEFIDDHPDPWHKNHPKMEGGEVNCHKNYTVEGDQVIIIGGGRGVSTVQAARKVGTDGSVTVYEASAQYVELIKQVIKLNEVSDRCIIKHVLVGPGFSIYGDQKSEDVTQILPQQLPQCDVLELDCEGAEFNILQNMTIRPRIIIVEIHPRKIDVSDTPTMVFDKLSSLNYKILDRRTNKGEVVTHEQLLELLEANEKGEAMAPVVAFVNQTTL